MKSADTNEKKRVVVSQETGLTIYSACAWPGWQDILISVIGFVIISIVLGLREEELRGDRQGGGRRC